MAQLVEENDKAQAEAGQDDAPEILGAEPEIERADAQSEHGQEETITRQPDSPRQLRVIERRGVRVGRRQAILGWRCFVVSQQPTSCRAQRSMPLSSASVGRAL